MRKRLLSNILIVSLLLCVAAGLQSRVYANVETTVTVKSDTNVSGGYVEMEPLPAPERTNSLMKHLNVSNLNGVTSAELLVRGAMLDKSGISEVYDTVYFYLNGFGWVLRPDDLPLPLVKGDTVKDGDLAWASIPIPNLLYLKDGINELVIWNSNREGSASRKPLVSGYDNNKSAEGSFAPQRGNNNWGGITLTWTNSDLNGERQGQPVGEWMIRCAGPAILMVA